MYASHPNEPTSEVHRHDGEIHCRQTPVSKIEQGGLSSITRTKMKMYTNKNYEGLPSSSDCLISGRLLPVTVIFVEDAEMAPVRFDTVQMGRLIVNPL